MQFEAFNPFQRDWTVDGAFVREHCPRLAASYAGIAVFTTPQIEVYREGGEIFYSVPLTLFDLLLALKPLLIRGCAAVIPNRVAYKTDFPFPNCTEAAVRFGSRVMDHVEITIPTICSSKTDVPAGVKTENALGMRLPLFTEAPLEDVIKMREDFETEHLNFQAAVKRIVNLTSHSTSSDTNLKAIAAEIEHQRNKLQEAYESEVRKLRSKGISVLVGSGVTFITILTPGLGEMLGHFVAANTVIDGVGYFRDKREMNKQLREAEFWWPWFLGKKHN